MRSNLPKITVVTVCFNAAASIKKTMESVLAQTYPNVEYLVIDGASTDNTLAVVESMRPAFLRRGYEFHCYSEKDSGIYDAMNKGIRLATGKWINFMNSGDAFCGPDVLMKTFQDDPAENVLYGDTIIQKAFGDILLKPQDINSLRKHMVFCHQSVFLPTSIVKEYPFVLEFRIVADYKFFYDYYQRGGSFRYLGYPIAYFEGEEGLSSTQALRAHKEKAYVNSEHERMTWQIKYRFKCMGYFVTDNAKRILPACVVEKVRAWNYERLRRRRLRKHNLQQMMNKNKSSLA